MDFNPQFQTPDQSYWNWSKSASQPEADKSTGIALQTAAEGIKGAVGIADTAIKDSIKNTLEDRDSAERDQFTDALTQLRQAAGKTNPADAMAQASDQDFMPDQGKPAPAPVSSGISKVQSV